MRHLHFHADVLVAAERRLVPQRDALGAAVAAHRLDLNQTGGRLERKPCDGILHRDPPGLEQRSGHADCVVTAHHRVHPVLLADHVAEGRLGARRGQEEVDVLARVAARLAEEQLPQPVEMLHHIRALLAHRAAGDGGHPADHHARRLARGVRVDHFEARGSCRAKRHARRIAHGASANRFEAAGGASVGERRGGEAARG
mmetsp:Transcript_25609/g.63371  ORF Transcript_25609/g.63371 Transcript_25609/m.63371 type:complete len:200 (+) Transcript_25609:884-1483(+)